MNKKNSIGLRVLLFLVISGVLIGTFISSCGKTNSSSATALNIQYQVVNLSPDLGPVSLFINYSVYKNLNFRYPTPSGYFFLSSIATPFQIRPSPNQISTTTIINTSNIFSLNDVLKPNLKYTLFITGINSTHTLDTLFLTDTGSTPTIGRGKLRFVNASPLSTGFNVLANDSLAFSNVQYNTVTKYIELPAGNYTFQVFATGNAGGVIGSEQNVTIQDGRLYTLYSYGVAGHTDSLAFGMGTLTNK
ncbi:MAG TPA: DUF4397 domain-containing protein [Mucilaginibacter sp.]|jgi:hypothetical protein|nr:DUF4397 domain-containing protein [Mucilaginibacter sp.]